MERPLIKKPFPIGGYARAIWAKLNDFAYKITTVNPDLSLKQLAVIGSIDRSFKPEHSTFDDAGRYESPDYHYLRKIRKIIKHFLEPGEIFADIGAGKGRVLCLMAQLPFKKVLGIEISQELCQIARENAKKCRWLKSPIEIRCEDAALSDLKNENYYFFFNPFGQNTFKTVLNHIYESQKYNYRKIMIIYYNAVHEKLLESCSWLELVGYFYTFSRTKVSFWGNSNF